ncbi:hypothetical protein ABPG75_008543 [Micractinium tetrahymenae]
MQQPERPAAASDAPAGAAPGEERLPEPGDLLERRRADVEALAHESGGVKMTDDMDPAQVTAILEQNVEQYRAIVEARSERGSAYDRRFTAGMRVVLGSYEAQLAKLRAEPLHRPAPGKPVAAFDRKIDLGPAELLRVPQEKEEGEEGDLDPASNFAKFGLPVPSEEELNAMATIQPTDVSTLPPWSGTWVARRLRRSDTGA